MKFKMGQKVKFWMKSCGRNHFGFFRGKEGSNAVIYCPALEHGIFDSEELMTVPMKDLVEYQESDKMEEAGEELNYMLRTSNENGIKPQFRQKIVEIIHLLGVQTDKERFGHGND